MAKVTKKIDNIDAIFFDSTKNENTWPKNVVRNERSPSGFSYGTLNSKTTKMGDGYPAIDGFVVSDKCWILVDGTGNSWIETEEEFNDKYSF